MYRILVILSVLVFLFTAACSVHTSADSATTKRFKNVQSYFKKSNILQNHLTGLVIYDLNRKEILFNKNGAKYFTPASNTKLLTLYAVLQTLGDSIPWMATREHDGEIIHYPLGDPSFLHPFLPQNHRISNYFLNRYEPGDTVYLSDDHFQDFRFGAGWSWDDHVYYFQSEKSVFPIHANVVRLIRNGELIEHDPSWMDVWTGYTDEDFRYRDEYAQVYVVPRDMDSDIYSPIITDRHLIYSYFKSLGLFADFVSTPLDLDSADIVYSMPTHDLCRYYVEESDNLIAEQLLLQCSLHKLGYMNASDIIAHFQENETQFLNPGWNWYDGSGLSRYNLVTPETMVSLLEALIAAHGLETIKDLLPAGGREGSISDWYGYDPPRVFAKTGTLKYCHNLSGIIQTRRGTHLAFSFMHNNFSSGSGPVKEAMTEVIDIIVERY